MLYCGSNKSAKDLDWSDKISSAFRGDTNQALAPVHVVFEHGVKRIGIPTLYAPQLDYTEGLPKARMGFTFMDTGKLEIVKFRLHQLRDDNPFFRMTGNKIPFEIDLTDGGAFFERYHLPTAELMPSEALNELKKINKEIYKYVKAFMYNYERALVRLKLIGNMIDPLEREKAIWRRNVGVTEQLYSVAGFPTYIKKVDAMRNDTRPPQLNPRLMGEEY